MVQDTTARAQEQHFMEAVRPARSFSAENVIAGKLRALYEENTQPSPSRITELLSALDDRDWSYELNLPASVAA